MTFKFILFRRTTLLLCLTAAALGLTFAARAGSPLLNDWLSPHQSMGASQALLLLATTGGALAIGAWLAPRERDRWTVGTFSLATGWIGICAVVDWRGGVIDAIGSALLIAVMLFALSGRMGDRAPFIAVWQGGLLLLIAARALALVDALSPGDFHAHSVTIDAIRAANTTGLALTALAGVYTVLRGSVSDHWLSLSITATGGLLAIAGALRMLPPSSLIALIHPIIVAIPAAHMHYALSHRDPNASLTYSGHWIAGGTILFLIAGSLQGVLALPDLHPLITGTGLTEAGDLLWSAAILHWMLGCGAASGAAKHGERVIGLMPFWLTFFATIALVGALVLAGVVHVSSERLIGLSFAESQHLIAPLYNAAAIAGGVLTLGIAVYAVSFAARAERGIPMSPTTQALQPTR